MIHTWAGVSVGDLFHPFEVFYLILKSEDNNANYVFHMISGLHIVSLKVIKS